MRFDKICPADLVDERRLKYIQLFECLSLDSQRITAKICEIHLNDFSFKLISAIKYTASSLPTTDAP